MQIVPILTFKFYHKYLNSHFDIKTNNTQFIQININSLRLVRL